MRSHHRLIRDIPAAGFRAVRRAVVSALYLSLGIGLLVALAGCNETDRAAAQRRLEAARQGLAFAQVAYSTAEAIYLAGGDPATLSERAADLAIARAGLAAARAVVDALAAEAGEAPAASPPPTTAPAVPPAP